MIDAKDFEAMRHEIEKQDSEREEVILKSREVLRLSKQLIYSVHRNDINDILAGKLKKEALKMKPMSGAYNDAMQEYAEAMCFYGLAKHKRLLTRNELKIDAESYLRGLCDLTGELVRKAINSSIKGDYKEAGNIREFVSELYGELIKFNFRNGELRRKFDRVKYDLNKLENLELDIKLRQK